MPGQDRSSAWTDHLGFAGDMSYQTIDEGGPATTPRPSTAMIHGPPTCVARVPLSASRRVQSSETVIKLQADAPARTR